MVRGIERTAIFRDDRDRADFVVRLARGAQEAGVTVYAWALLPNHAHFLVKTGQRPLPRVMRALLTGYAGAFNRRHKRTGHLFQNRYRSIVVEEEPYLLELVRYVHLNPLRAGVLHNLRALDRYPWTGHSALIGIVPRPWQDTQTILSQFGVRLGRARRAYRGFVADGVPAGRRPEFQGGGLLRSLGGWERLAALRRGREAYLGDPRILGSGEFVAQLQREIPLRLQRLVPSCTLEALAAAVCSQVGIQPAMLQGGGRVPAVTRARAGIAYLWMERLGHPGRPLAPMLGIHPAVVYQAARRGAAHAQEWDRLLRRIEKTTKLAASPMPPMPGLPM